MNKLAFLNDIRNNLSSSKIIGLGIMTLFIVLGIGLATQLISPSSEAQTTIVHMTVKLEQSEKMVNWEVSLKANAQLKKRSYAVLPNKPPGQSFNEYCKMSNWKWREESGFKDKGVWNTGDEYTDRAKKHLKGVIILTDSDMSRNNFQGNSGYLCFKVKYQYPYHTSGDKYHYQGMKYNRPFQIHHSSNGKEISATSILSDYKNNKNLWEYATSAADRLPEGISGRHNRVKQTCESNHFGGFEVGHKVKVEDLPRDTKYICFKYVWNKRISRGGSNPQYEYGIAKITQVNDGIREGTGGNTVVGQLPPVSVRVQREGNIVRATANIEDQHLIWGRIVIVRDKSCRTAFNNNDGSSSNTLRINGGHANKRVCFKATTKTTGESDIKGLVISDTSRDNETQPSPPRGGDDGSTRIPAVPTPPRDSTPSPVDIEVDPEDDDPEDDDPTPPEEENQQFFIRLRERQLDNKPWKAIYGQSSRYNYNIANHLWEYATSSENDLPKGTSDSDNNIAETCKSDKFSDFKRGYRVKVEQLEAINAKYICFKYVKQDEKESDTKYRIEKIEGLDTLPTGETPHELFVDKDEPSGYVWASSGHAELNRTNHLWQYAMVEQPNQCNDKTTFTGDGYKFKIPTAVGNKEYVCFRASKTLYKNDNPKRDGANGDYAIDRSKSRVFVVEKISELASRNINHYEIQPFKTEDSNDNGGKIKYLVNPDSSNSNYGSQTHNWNYGQIQYKIVEGIESCQDLSNYENYDESISYTSTQISHYVCFKGALVDRARSTQGQLKSQQFASAQISSINTEQDIPPSGLPVDPINVIENPEDTGPRDTGGTPVDTRNTTTSCAENEELKDGVCSITSTGLLDDQSDWWRIAGLIIIVAAGIGVARIMLIKKNIPS